MHKVRCKLCGTDHPYRDDIERMMCDECDMPLKMENTRLILAPRQVQPSDPLEGM